jgi:hypothetical protein
MCRVSGCTAAWEWPKSSSWSSKTCGRPQKVREARWSVWRSARVRD